MKTDNVVLVLAIAVLVFGGILAYSGYNESLQLTTVTRTESLTTTLTETARVTSTESRLVTTSTTRLILRAIYLEPPSEQFCGMYEDSPVTLVAGQLRVSYNTEGGQVDFWMLSEEQWQKWKETPSCTAVRGLPAIASRFSSTAHEFTLTISTSAVYHFVFLNTGTRVSVFLRIDSGPYRTQITAYEYQTLDVTWQTVFPTLAARASTNPVGLGVPFFSGVGLAAAGIALGVSGLRKSRRISPAPPTIRVGAPKQVKAAPAVPSAKPKLAGEVGAEIREPEMDEYAKRLARLGEVRARGEITEIEQPKLKEEPPAAPAPTPALPSAPIAPPPSVQPSAEVVKKALAIPPRLEPVISTGYADLDRSLAGGIPEGYAVAFVSPSYDERDLLIRKIIDSALSSGRAVVYISGDIRRTQDLVETYWKNFLAFSPQADRIASPPANLYKTPGFENLSDFNISLAKAIDTRVKTSGKLIIIDILSDVLLYHKALTTRRWLADFVAKRKAEGFTILGTINPLIAKEDTQTLVDLFDGVIEIYERELKERPRRFLIVRKMYARKYTETELMLERDKLF